MTAKHASDTPIARKAYFANDHEFTLHMLEKMERDRATLIEALRRSWHDLARSSDLFAVGIARDFERLLRELGELE